jgi:hypothetical protein
MKKIGGTILVLSTILIFSGCGQTQENASNNDQLAAIIRDDASVAPTRPAEINGIISSLEGNKLIVKNEVGKPVLSEEEMAKQKAERQKMTQEERQALKAQETANAKTEDVSIEVPVGKTILKGTGDGSGNSMKASFEDLKKGIYVSIWMLEGKIEVIKIKGL